MTAFWKRLCTRQRDCLILDEIEDEARWRDSFSKSQDQLAALAAGVREQIARSDVRDEDPSTASE